MTTFAAPQLTESAVESMVRDWYTALDQHVPFEELLPFVVPEGLTMRFPEGVSEGLDGFRSWYEAVTHRFFDEIHDVRSVTVRETGPDRVEVKVLVNWQTSVWEPPAAVSRWLGFDAYQTWTVVSGGDGTPRILSYTVDDLAAMPGSGSL